MLIYQWLQGCLAVPSQSLQGQDTLLWLLGILGYFEP